MTDKLARVAEETARWGALDEMVASLKSQAIAEPSPLPYPLASDAESEADDVVSF